MELATELKNIAGAQDLFDWFGYWPNFHDSTMLSFEVSPTGSSHLRVHTWELNTCLDQREYFIKHVVVEFIFDGISRLDMEGIGGQDVILGLDIHKVDSGFKLSIDSCYRAGGEIVAGNVEIRLFPGEPTAAR
jgi:hypothetical protein